MLNRLIYICIMPANDKIPIALWTTSVPYFHTPFSLHSSIFARKVPDANNFQQIGHKPFATTYQDINVSQDTTVLCIIMCVTYRPAQCGFATH